MSEVTVSGSTQVMRPGHSSAASCLRRPPGLPQAHPIGVEMRSVPRRHERRRRPGQCRRDAAVSGVVGDDHDGHRAAGPGRFDDAPYPDPPGGVREGILGRADTPRRRRSSSAGRAAAWRASSSSWLHSGGAAQAHGERWALGSSEVGSSMAPWVRVGRWLGFRRVTALARAAWSSRAVGIEGAVGVSAVVDGSARWRLGRTARMPSGLLIRELGDRMLRWVVGGAQARVTAGLALGTCAATGRGHQVSPLQGRAGAARQRARNLGDERLGGRRDARRRGPRPGLLALVPSPAPGRVQEDTADDAVHGRGHAEQQGTPSTWTRSSPRAAEHQGEAQEQGGRHAGRGQEPAHAACQPVSHPPPTQATRRPGRWRPGRSPHPGQPRRPRPGRASRPPGTPGRRQEELGHQHVERSGYRFADLHAPRIGSRPVACDNRCSHGHHSCRQPAPGSHPR